MQRKGDRRMDVAAPRRGQPSGREPVAGTAARRGAGIRPLHPRGVGRLPGPVRRGVLRHRQGDLRRRRVRPGGRRALPQQPGPLLPPRGRWRGWPVHPRAGGTRNTRPGYEEDVRRRYRWIGATGRPWRWSPPGPPRPGTGWDAEAGRSPPSLLCRWKLFDNLRRSLTPAAWSACRWWTAIVACLGTLAGVGVRWFPP